MKRRRRRLRKTIRAFVRKKPTNANNAGSAWRKLNKEVKDDDDDHDKPIKSSLSGSRPKAVKKKEIDEDDDEKPLSSVGVSKPYVGGSISLVFRRES
ncbi:hypothetical protein DY000_02023927 [Brassica cretica]|uniref:Uncharacterized protein n=1 Tax=Brassica cretica TaxID=69181 RepID=A0ABQ7E2B1_BRACR|nr:hypothetical protein DY000_02023927 [Brassica cretica]